MDQPVKPFACGITDCGMSFTNEDHLHVHRKKHDMVLQLGIEQKAAFVADQTPTPTRFIRNCEEVGLFQELQNVNPFDEGFKKAMEIRQENLLDAPTLTPVSNDDVLHTPQNIFPTLTETTDTTYYSSTNIQKSITTQSTQDETGCKIGAKITKLLNEVTTNKKNVLNKITVTDDISIIRLDEVSHSKDKLANETVSFSNNVVKINSASAIKKCDNITNNDHGLSCSVSLREQFLDDFVKIKAPLIISQKSLDQVVDSLNSEPHNNTENNIKEEECKKALKKNLVNIFLKKTLTNTENETIENNSKRKKIEKNISDSTEDYEVVIKFPTGKCVRMKAIEEQEEAKSSKLKELEAKQKLKQVITEKYEATKNVIVHQNKINILPKGTLIPVTVVNTGPFILPKVSQKVAIPQNASMTSKLLDPIGVKQTVINTIEPIRICVKSEKEKDIAVRSEILPKSNQSTKKEFDELVEHKLRRQKVSQRYRERIKIKQAGLKEQISKQESQIKMLTKENAVLKSLLLKHMQKCPQGDDIRNSTSVVFVTTS